MVLAVVIDGLILVALGAAPSFFAVDLVLHHLILERGHGQQVLKEKVKEDE